MLKKLASFYDRTDALQKQEIEKMFITGTKYFLDQGWQAGSSGGTRHHIGYNVREITEAFYIMRGTLKKERLLNEVERVCIGCLIWELCWTMKKNSIVNIDYLNTRIILPFDAHFFNG